MVTKKALINCRLACQQLSATAFTRGEDLVGWMGCLQAQDFGAAKWAIGSRLKADAEQPTDAGIENLLNEGRILRTHVLRPTWHLVAPADIRWMLRLTAPKIKALSAGPRRQLGMDKAMFKRSNAALEKALKGGKKLMRQEIELVFRQARLRTDEYRIAHLLMEAELDGIICSAGMRGRQLVYALLDEWAPEEKTEVSELRREEALALLALRYFRSRGPASLADFAWWSGLTLSEARQGVEAHRSRYEQVTVDGANYWCHGDAMDHMKDDDPSGTFALPAYDEYTIAYADRSLVVAPGYKLWTPNGILKPAIVHNGQVVGVWQRSVGKSVVTVKTELFRKTGKRAVRGAFERYSDFVGKKLELE